MTAWYYSDYERNRHGPVSAADLAELHANGQLAPDTLVWREGLPQWQPWHQLMGEVVPGAGRPAVASASFATAPADAAPSVGANPYAVAEPESPYAPPRTVIAEYDDFQSGGEVVYAGFWKRFAALFIDSIVVGVAYYAVLILAMIVMGVGLAGLTGSPDAAGSGVFALIALVYLSYPLISAAYYVSFESSSKQATLGKMAVGIKVGDREGRRLSRAHALGRWASHIVCYLTIYIGYLMAAFTERKQGLHDMLASTLVVDQWAYTAHPERQRRELGVVTIVIMALALLAILVYIGIIVAIAIPAYQSFLQRAQGG